MRKSAVHLFIFDTMFDWEYGYVIAGINNPQFQKVPGIFNLKTAALSDKPVTSMGGLRITPELTLDMLTPASSAMFVLPGGTAWDKKMNEEAAQMAAEFLTKAIPVKAICGATTGLARVGLLDMIPHASNSKDYLAQTGYQGTQFYQDKPTVRSGYLITASSMSPIEFAREIFSTLGIYSDKVLTAWYNLYKTGDAKYFAELMKAAEAK